MSTASSQLLPIDGFTYETAFGRYTASVGGSTPAAAAPAALQKVEVELRNESFAFCPVRRLTLCITPEDLDRHRSRVFRLIHEWAMSDPGSENYFAVEVRYGDQP